MMNSKITFDEEQRRPISPQRQSGGLLTKLVMKYSGGRITTPRQASLVLLVILFVCIFTYFLIPIGQTNEPVEEIEIMPGETVGSPQGR